MVGKWSSVKPRMATIKVLMVLIVLTGSWITIVKLIEYKIEYKDGVEEVAREAGSSIFLRYSKDELLSRLNDSFGELRYKEGTIEYPLAGGRITYTTSDGSEVTIVEDRFDGSVSMYSFIFEFNTEGALDHPLEFDELQENAIALLNRFLLAFDTELGNDYIIEIGSSDNQRYYHTVYVRQTWNGRPLDGSGLKTEFNKNTGAMVRAAISNWLDTEGSDEVELSIMEAQEKVMTYLEEANFTVQAFIDQEVDGNRYGWSEFVRVPVEREAVSLVKFGVVYGALCAFYSVQYYYHFNITKDQQWFFPLSTDNISLSLNTTIKFVYSWAFDVNNGRLMYWSNMGESTWTERFFEANLFGDNLDWSDLVEKHQPTYPYG